MGLFFTRARPAGGDQRASTQWGVDPLSAAVAARASGKTTAAPVTFDSSLSVSSAWACAWLYADLVSTMPVECLRTVAGIDVPMATPPVLISPAGEQVYIEEWLSMSQLSLELRGNAFGEIVARDGLGFPRQIELVHPDSVRVHRDRNTGQLVYWFGNRRLDAAQVWHERARTPPGSPVGLSVIEAAARQLGVNIAVEQFGSDWFADGAHPTAIFANKNQQDPGVANAKAFKERVMAATSGNREPLVLGSGWDYQALQVNPNESQFLETMQYGGVKVCQFFQVPPELIGEASSGSSITYANVEQRMAGFLILGLGSRLVRRERALSRLLPSPQRVKLNRKGLLASDLLARFQAYQIAINAGFLTQDEARAEEDRMPLTDEQVTQLHTIKATGIASAAAPATSPTTTGVLTP